MMEVNVEEVQESIKKARLTLEKKLSNMVAGFASELARSISEGTPMGNPSDLAAGLANNAGSAGSYAQYYLSREKNLGIEAAVGFHSGAWVYSESGNPSFDPNIYVTEQVESEVLADARSQYKLGEDFYIAAKGSAFGNVIQIQDIQVSYSVDFKRYFDLG